MQRKNSQNPIIKSLKFAKQKAIIIFMKVFGKNTDRSGWVNLKKGDHLLNQGLIPEATEFYKNLIHQQPKSRIGFVGLARIAQLKENWEKCIDLYANCFRQFPEHEKEFWYLHLAEAYNKLGNEKEALKYYETCSIKYPDKVTSFVELAQLAQCTNQWQKALDYWQICFDRFPNSVRPLWHQKKQRVLIELGLTYDVQEEALELLKLQGSREYVEIIRQKRTNKASHMLHFQHILIITYGRSGSTLLQGILNTIDGVVIRGENDNIFFDLFKTYQKFIDLKNHHKTAVLPNQPWYGISFFDEDLLLAHYRELAKGFLLADQYNEDENLCVGFKEIRYDKIGDDLEAYLDFLSKLFPNAAFVFNTRNLEDVTKSAWWKEADRDTVFKDLSTLENRFETYAKTEDFCYQINYNDIITKGQKLQDLFRFLGASYHPEIIDFVLSTPHSYSPEQDHVKKLFNKI